MKRIISLHIAFVLFLCFILPLNISAYAIDNSYKSWKQYDSRWGSTSTGGNETLKKSGCLVTACAILMVKSGSEPNDINQFNPGTLATRLLNDGFLVNGNMSKGLPEWYSPNFYYELNNPTEVLPDSYNTIYGKIQNWLNSGYYIIVGVKWNNGVNGHWVAVDYCSDGEVYIMDPGYKDRTTLRVYDGGISGIKLIRANNIYNLPDPIIPSCPRIENPRITKITSSGYTVQCEVYDDINPVTRVAFPTWTTHTDNSGNEQDDIKWADGTISGATATFEVKTSDHNNELGYYRTHIYCYNTTGASSAVAVPDVYIEDVKPKISDVKIINQTSTTYTVQCKVVDDESGIDRVQFPTWTSENDQDDIVKDWWTNPAVGGTIKDNIATFTVNISDHNNETGEYNTHIYVFDKCGNYDCIGWIVNVGIYKLSIDPNGGSYDNSTSIVTKEHILRYGFKYWCYIAESEYGNAARNGYTLTGYFDKPTGGIKVYDSNGIALDTEYFKDHIYLGNGDLTVYAQWQIIHGDINADNNITVADNVLLQKWLLSVPDTELLEWKAGDINEDGRLNAVDLTLLRRILINV